MNILKFVYWFYAKLPKKLCRILPDEIELKRYYYRYYNYFPNLNIKIHDDNLLTKKAKIIHFAGGPKPWRVPICEANNYTRIKEWYNYADSLGITSNWDYIKCYSQLPFRKIWRKIKKVLKYLLKW